MENDESTDQSNTSENRSPFEDQDKDPGKTDNPWKHDIFDDTDPNMRKEPTDPKRTLFY